MFGFGATEGSNAISVLKALGCSLAIIEFGPDGKVLAANKNFCAAFGYDASEIVGRHHSMFVEPSYANSHDYTTFWEKLRSGEFDAREYKRIGKNGREVWIQASYNPVKGKSGVVLKVVKVATDITAEKLRNAEFEGKLNAISLAQAIIEFTTSGEVITANRNFLDVLGYSLDEVRGKHHHIFVDPAYARSPEYQDFWKKLNSGEFISASFKRIGKGGKEVWIQANYNPIVDMNGKVMKIVKFANDISDLTYIGAGLARLADKVLDQDITRAFGPTYEQLRTDFNLASSQLRSTLEQIVAGTENIDSGVREISTASDDLSRRTEQQAASLEETAAALDQITATVRKTAEGSKHARQVVSLAKTSAEHSCKIVRQAVEAMSGIEKSSNQISNIIGIIDEIAFQTNLLALNAGVEAARAGEAGRGFAVVASEVRALAQRSAEAAKEIKTLISASSQQVEQGVNLVGQTGKALEEIVVQVAEINRIVTEIAASAQEQAVALDEVNTAVNQMDQVTQQNAARVERATAASQTLSRETEDLTGIVGQFQLGQPVSTGQQARKAMIAPKSKPVAAMKVEGRSGAARKPLASTVDWQEF